MREFLPSYLGLRHPGSLGESYNNHINQASLGVTWKYIPVLREADLSIVSYQTSLFTGTLEMVWRSV